MSDTKLDDETERLIMVFRHCLLSDTCVDDLSPYTIEALAALRDRVRELESEAFERGFVKGQDNIIAAREMCR